MFGVKSSFNEEFLRDLAEKTHRGMEGRVRDGLSSGGLPYGYHSEPIISERGQITGHRRVIHEPEAKVVRRIFQLYADGYSAREIAKRLTTEGIAPPGALWPNRARRVKAWSPSTISGGRTFKKGILRNSIYVGRPLWNRSRYLLDPDTRMDTHRVRPASEWVEVSAPELRIVSEDLWEKVQRRLTLHEVPRAVIGRRNVGNYLLSGFVKCAECGGAYVKTDHSYRCGIHRNSGQQGCSNSRGVKVAKLERLIISALRERLYTPENMKAIIERVRHDLLTRAKREAQAARPDENAKQLRAVEAEIEHIKRAVKIGKATESLLEMLEDAERRRKALLAGLEAPKRGDAQARLERVLSELPKRVQAYLEDLETLLARHQVERGKDILASLGMEVVISADGTAEIRGDLRKALTLVSSRKESESLWSGEPHSSEAYIIGTRIRLAA